MKKKIAVLTATRAEYGLLKNIIIVLKEISELDEWIRFEGATGKR